MSVLITTLANARVDQVKAGAPRDPDDTELALAVSAPEERPDLERRVMREALVAAGEGVRDLAVALFSAHSTYSADQADQPGESIG